MISVIRVLLPASVVGFGIFLLVGGWRAYLQDVEIVNQGSRAKGQVIQKQVEDGEGTHIYVVEYRFLLPNGKTLTAERGISETLWRQLTPGDLIEICYDTAEPDRNFPLGGGNTSIAIILLISAMGTAITLGGTVAGIKRFGNPDINNSHFSDKIQVYSDSA